MSNFAFVAGVKGFAFGGIRQGRRAMPVTGAGVKASGFCAGAGSTLAAGFSFTAVSYNRYRISKFVQLTQLYTVLNNRVGGYIAISFPGK